MEDPPGLQTDAAYENLRKLAAHRLGGAGDGDDDDDGKKPPDNYSDLAEFDIQTNKTEECRLLHGSTTGSLEYLCIDIHTVSIGAMLLVCNCILISLL